MVFASDQNKSSEYQALLRCFVSYADKTEIIETIAHERGYEVKPTDIGGRFTFKAVMIGTSTKINHISLYAYFQATPKDLPIHEAIYRGPFAPSQIPVLITPYNHLYAGEVERELKYHCELSKVKK
ncbi:hypothetical protein H8K35_13055 [Undibacterium sp. LX40W]|uniref:Uncharacterized protein n=1 Tax=Undibacterium nitidum TaxID=2762298 RepID=A0A923KTJ5_9BURK|nr:MULTISPECIES: hypothetical protein [Undibacterium]MBC3882316.1 hypothetical protein [Undibacterium nitidum]MBC3892597.1 hypothetical protein [Undibacterium sp. LX40W]